MTRDDGEHRGISRVPTTFFFSYARANSDFVLTLAKDLRAAGADLWLDQLDIGAGERWDHAVERALERCEGLILVLSPESMASQNVQDEVSYALDEDKWVIPVLYLACKIPLRIRRLQYIDLSGNHYEAGLAQLRQAMRLNPRDDDSPVPSVQDPTVPTPGKPTTSPAPPEPRADPEPHPVWNDVRLRHGVLGGTVGFGLGLVLTFLSPGDPWTWGLIPGLSGAAVGMASGDHPARLRRAMQGAAIGWTMTTVLVYLVFSGETFSSALYPFVLGGVFGASAGGLAGLVRGIARAQRQEPSS